MKHLISLPVVMVALVAVLYLIEVKSDSAVAVEKREATAATETIAQEEKLHSLSFVSAADAAPDVELYATYIVSVNRRVFPELARYIAEGVIAASQEFSVPPLYLLALAQVESTFQYDAISDANCVGLTQINPGIWLKEDHAQSLQKAGIARSRKDLYDPKTNLRAGAYVLSTYLVSEDGRIKRALNRYLGANNKRYQDKFILAVGNFSLYKETASGLL
jgi:soluble lytic murein transglycosylase-like protein